MSAAGAQLLVRPGQRAGRFQRVAMSSVAPDVTFVEMTPAAGTFARIEALPKVDFRAGDDLAGMSGAERYDFVMKHIPKTEGEAFHAEVTRAAFEAVERMSIGHLAHVLAGWEATAYLYAHPGLAAEVTAALNEPDEGPGVDWRKLRERLCGE